MLKAKLNKGSRRPALYASGDTDPSIILLP
jgi:hypothetical protein